MGVEIEPADLAAILEAVEQTVTHAEAEASDRPGTTDST